jgi:NAD-dependent deacetylase
VDKKLVEKIANSKKVVFFTGAGISSESGIPTFRGKNGIWNKLKPEELANFDAFLKNPKLVWEWYIHRKQIINESKPNAGHLAIAESQNIFPEVTIVTQNIDSLHKRAGSNIVYELHGNIERNYCIKCSKYYNEELDFSKGVPQCSCGGLIRPDVVWFGEYLPEDQFEASEKAAKNCDLFFIIGTSAVVYPAASLIFTAKQGGAYLVEVNIEETEISPYANKLLLGLSGEVLPALMKEVQLILTA